MDYLTHILAVINSTDKLPWVLAAAVTSLIYLFQKMQKGDNVFEFSEMFFDPDSKLTSLTRFGTFVALITTTWGFVYLTLHDQLTEMFLTAYVGTWAGANLVSKGIAAYASKKVDKDEDKDDNTKN